MITPPHTTRPGDQPYVGLRPYRQRERTLFFGRDRESREVSTIWQAAGLSVLYGASGVGKTSLLHAGVLPRLDPERVDLLPIARVSPSTVLPLAPRLPGNPYVLALLSSWAPDQALPVLAGMTVSGFLSRRPERVDRYGDPMPILAAIDQAEEVFRGPTFRENERLAFLGQLADAVRDHDGLHLLLSLREEYLFTVLPHERALGQGSRTRFHLLPLTRETALEAATMPLNHTDRFFAPGAAELLVDDLRTVTISNDEGIETELTLDSVEPVQLQVVCSALWESLPPGLREITMEHTRLYADVDRFLVRFCRRVLTEVSEEHDVPVSQIQFWLRNAFITEHGTRNTVYEGLRETASMPNAVARSLEDRHILKAEHRLGIRWYELQHDRLIGPIHRHESPSVYLKEAREALARKNWAPARKLAEEAVRASRFEEVWVRAEATEIFGEVAASEGEIETARRHFEEAADMFAAQQRFDGVARVLTADGRLWLAQGAHDRAIQQFKTALSWVPNDVPAQLALGEALWHSGKPSAALALLNGALALTDTPPAEALAFRGEILADLGQAEAALRDLNRVRQHQQPATIAARALALALTQRFDAAEQEMLDAIANESGSGPVLHRAARINALLGRPRKSASFASQALDATAPELPPHLRRQAESLLRESA